MILKIYLLCSRIIARRYRVFNASQWRLEHTLLEDKVYIRLFHNKSLTQRRDTGMQSAYRKKVRSNIDTKTDWDVPFEPVTTDLQLIE